MANEILEKAIKEKDLTTIRSTLYTIILSDPAFRTNKFDETLEYVKKKDVEGLIDEHNKEELKPKEEWNEEYFDLLLSELLDNFSIERIEYIKKVSKELYTKNVKKTDSKKTTNNYVTSNRKKSEPKKEKTNSSVKKVVVKQEKKEDKSYVIVLAVIALIGYMIKKLFKED